MSDKLPQKSDEELREMLKKRFIEELQKTPEMTVQEASESVEREPRTIWIWANEDPEFKREIESVQARQIKQMHDETLSETFKKIKGGDSKVRESTNFLKYLDRLKDKTSSDKDSLIDPNQMDRIGGQILRAYLIKQGVDLEDTKTTEDIVTLVKKGQEYVLEDPEED